VKRSEEVVEEEEEAKWKSRDVSVVAACFVRSAAK